MVMHDHYGAGFSEYSKGKVKLMVNPGRVAIIVYPFPMAVFSRSLWPSLLPEDRSRFFFPSDYVLNWVVHGSGNAEYKASKYKGSKIGREGASDLVWFL